MRFLVSGPVVLDLLFAHHAQARIVGRVVRVGGPAVNVVARTELLQELGILRVVDVFRFFQGVQVVKVRRRYSSKPCTVGRILVAVAEVVLAELAGHIAVVLQQLGDGRVLDAQALLGTRQDRPWSNRCGTESDR